MGPNRRDPNWKPCGSGCFSFNCSMTSSERGKIPPPWSSLRYRNAELTRFSKIFALFGGSVALWEFPRRLCIMHPSRRIVSASPFFYKTRCFAKQSWWSFDFDLGQGFCRQSARRTIATLRAMNSISEPLFHLLISSFNVSMNSFPVFPKGTKMCFYAIWIFHHRCSQ